MSNKEEPIKTPPKPERAIVTALKSAVGYGAAGAAFGALNAKLPFLKEVFNKGIKKEAIENAAIWAVVGAVFGYARGVTKNAEYPLKVENAELKHELSALRDDSTKSFVQTVKENSADKNSNLVIR